MLQIIIPIPRIVPRTQMQIYQLVGDVFHLLAIITILCRIVISKNAMGLSLKTQRIYLSVFAYRYFGHFVLVSENDRDQIYFKVMCVLLACITYLIVILMKNETSYHVTYSIESDSFQELYLSHIYHSGIYYLSKYYSLIYPFDYLDLGIDHGDFTSTAHDEGNQQNRKYRMAYGLPTYTLSILLNHALAFIFDDSGFTIGKKFT